MDLACKIESAYTSPPTRFKFAAAVTLLQMAKLWLFNSEVHF